ncbi:MAG: hypothetical protein ABI662_06695 [Dermatophilaceae bacterium]
MNLDDRLTQAIRDIADHVVPPLVDLDAVRSAARTNRVRVFSLAVALVVVAVAVAATVLMGGRDLGMPSRPAGPPTVEQTARGALADGTFIIDSLSGHPGQWEPSDVRGLPAPGSAPYPPWKAVDQARRRFLYTSDGITGASSDEDLFTARVVAAGTDTPVATIRCGHQCNWQPTFGPGPDEVTLLVESEPGGGYPTEVVVYGFDGGLRQTIDLKGLLKGQGSLAPDLGFGIGDLAWSPDGRQLAVSTYTGGREPGCFDLPCEARVWVVDEAGGNAELIHSVALRKGQRYQPDPASAPVLNPPLLTGLAWTSDGKRLGMIATTYYPSQAAPATLQAQDVRTGQTTTVYQFDDCGACNQAPSFTWSPDGRRIAVTTAAGIAQLDSEGTALGTVVVQGHGPLAWIAKRSG